MHAVCLRCACSGVPTLTPYPTLQVDGSVFDQAKTFSFQLGGGDVIKGWDLGIVGMKKGEKRRLTIPPSLGYGKRGSGKDIPPDSTLVFEVTLKGIQ